MGHDKTRTENPGVRDKDRASSLPNPNINEPWISNYPPLHDWLMANDARCDFQQQYGKKPNHWYIEQWRMPGSLPFIVVVMSHQHGWDIYTPSGSNSIDETLKDVRARIYPGVK